MHLDRGDREGDPVRRRRRASTTAATATFKPKLKAWSFEERKSKDVFEGVDDLSLAADGNTVLIRNDKAYKAIDLKAGKPEPQGRRHRRPVRAGRSESRIRRDLPRSVAALPRSFLRAEHERLRLERAARQVRAAAADVGDRSDLNYVLGQMVAELSIRTPTSAAAISACRRSRTSALLGARFELDAASGRYRIAQHPQGRERRGSLPLAADRSSASTCTRATT